MTKAHNRPIAEWQSGDLVRGFALVTRFEARADRNGREYADLDLADASGAVNAKLWPDAGVTTSGIRNHQFVAFDGQVQSYRDQLQLVLKKLRPAAEADRPFGFDESRLVPSTREDIDVLWRRLTTVLATVQAPPLARLVAETLAVHGPALRTHPAARTVHHAVRGGLLEHVTKMAEVAADVCARYPEVDRELVLVAVLFHDLGKLQELGAMPANDYTPVGRLVGHVVLGRDLLRERLAAIPAFPPEQALHLEHLVLSHQGRREFGAPVEPMTAEAVVLHAIDDLDAKLAQLREARASATGFQFLRPMGRTMWLDPGAGSEGPVAGAGAAPASKVGTEAATVPAAREAGGGPGEPM
jgi:3'-5' exoribonuclease